ncbi:uncharacterized protein LOC123680926 [Harmonia axyridis]|uniref:uncharacterized protein LOC123680926 n=1 Tax=Harmonia axyridis TaxID=115357 RepID=UPI001E278282|nr:uncharacterized protein LOC123680926 [Harmonia axyridis]
MCLGVVASAVRAEWVDDLYSSRGLDLGGGFSIQLENHNASDKASFLEKNTVKMSFANYGLSIAKDVDKNFIELDLLRQDPGKGRAQKMGNMILPAVIGFKAAGITSAILFTMKVLVIKAFMVAKFALLISSAIFVKKFFFHEHHHEPTYVEIEHHEPETHPIFLGHEGGNEGHGTTNYLAYANYVPSAAAQTQVVNYAVEAPVANYSGTGQQQIIVPIAAKRADSKRLPKLPLYTIRKYTAKSI